MTTNNDDVDTPEETVPIAARLPKFLVAWLEEKRTSLRATGLNVSFSQVLRQQLERIKRIDDEPGPKGPKKARTTT